MHRPVRACNRSCLLLVINAAIDKVRVVKGARTRVTAEKRGEKASRPSEQEVLRALKRRVLKVCAANIADISVAPYYLCGLMYICICLMQVKPGQVC